MKKAYKVIKSNRYSFIISRENPYCLKYMKDTIVEGVKGTFGVMCFEMKKNAKDFIEDQHFKNSIIIKVFLIGKIKYPKLVARQLHGYDIKQFYKLKKCIGDWRITYPPKGTICCDKIKVLT